MRNRYSDAMGYVYNIGILFSIDLKMTEIFINMKIDREHFSLIIEAWSGSRYHSISSEL